jgi:hypothetical protein
MWQVGAKCTPQDGTIRHDLRAVALELATRASQTGGMTASDDRIAVLRIELQDIEPLIWRRVAVLTSMNLRAVHSVIQAVMGWLDNHLWEFTTNERKYSILISNDPDWNKRIINAATTKLAALLTTGITEISYVYDIGDNWQHRIIVEKLKPAELGALYPQFLGGERRCPPEDCGGFPGYYDFLDNIASKQGERRKAALDWYGRPYDPDDIDDQQIVINLRSIANPRRPGRSKAVKT